MADEGGRKRRGPYLQYLSDSSDRVVPRTTRYRWDKKVRVAGDSQECGLQRINSENQSDFTSLNPETELSDDDRSTAFGCHFPEQDSSYCSTEVDSVEPTWFANEGGEFVTVYRFEEFMSMTEEPALLTDGRQDVDDYEMSFADDFHDDTEICYEEEIDKTNANEQNASHESSHDEYNQPLYPGCRLSLEISMLLVVTFCIRHALSGVALADLLTLIELHCLLPNHFAKSTKLLRDFFGQLKSPIEFHYYCSFCQEYLGTRKPKCCSNAASLCDFEKKRSDLRYFIVIPFVIQLQAIIQGKLRFNSKYETINNTYSEFNITCIFPLCKGALKFLIERMLG